MKIILIDIIFIFKSKKYFLNYAKYIYYLYDNNNV